MKRSVIIVLSFLFILTGTALAQVGPRDAAGGFISEKGNTTYEELTSLAFDAQHRSVVGTILIKQVVGFSGNHVVACWVDWDKNGDFRSAYATNDYVGSVTRYTGNPPTAPVTYGVTIPVSPLPGKVNQNYPIKCILTWMQEITSSSMDPIWGNALTGTIHIDAVY